MNVLKTDYPIPFLLLVEMDVISNGPVTRKLQSLFSSNDTGSGSECRSSAKIEDGFALKMWNQVIELFDKNGPYLTVDTGSLAFLCLNFLRFIAIILIIPLWFILGLISFGLLWPPQIRQKLMRQTISMENSIAIVKAEQQRNNLVAVQRSMAATRQELSASITIQKEQVQELKEGLSTLQKDVMFEMQHVKHILETLVGMQEAHN